MEDRRRSLNLEFYWWIACGLLAILIVLLLAKRLIA